MIVNCRKFGDSPSLTGHQTQMHSRGGEVGREVKGFQFSFISPIIQHEQEIPLIACALLAALRLKVENLCPLRKDVEHQP